MDRSEAQQLAQTELRAIRDGGYALASEHLDTATLKMVTCATGSVYEVELSYQWKGAEHEEILVICRVSAKKWFTHQYVEESITLSSG